MTRSQWTIPHVMNRTWPNREQRAPSASNRTLPTPSTRVLRTFPPSTHTSRHNAAPHTSQVRREFPLAVPVWRRETRSWSDVNRKEGDPQHRCSNTEGPCNRSEGNTQACSQAMLSNPTTGFLTATTFIYALGAGITAAAGTRLALQ